MTESDLFVDLLDDKELDRIIKDHKIVMDESYLAALSECHAPEYIKLVYSLVYRKHVIKEFLPDIILRHQSGEESLFNYSYLIVSDEIAIQVVKNAFGLDGTFTIVENSFNVQQKRQIAKIWYLTISRLLHG